MKDESDYCINMYHVFLLHFITLFIRTNLTNKAIIFIQYCTIAKIIGLTDILVKHIQVNKCNLASQCNYYRTYITTKLQNIQYLIMVNLYQQRLLKPNDKSLAHWRFQLFLNTDPIKLELYYYSHLQIFYFVMISYNVILVLIVFKV